MCKLVVVLGHKFPSLLLNQWRSRQVHPKDCGSHNGSNRPVVFSGDTTNLNRFPRQAEFTVPLQCTCQTLTSTGCTGKIMFAPGRRVANYCYSSQQISLQRGDHPYGLLLKQLSHRCPVCRAERIACRCTQPGAISATLPPATGEVGLDVQQFCLPTMGSMQAIPAKSLIPRNRY